MTEEPVDYAALGLRCGLEIHQQLSSKKLFSESSTDMKEEGEEIRVVRMQQRALAGESGDVDLAAAAESVKRRVLEYVGYKGEYCLVDLDEEPPHDVNPDALATALGVAKALNMIVPDSIYFMRKTIIDGSVCSAFQRTALVALQGPESVLHTSQGPVSVALLGLEEDACKIIERGHDKVVYSLSRQGVPLIELSTGPDIVSPSHMKEVARKIGLLLRSFTSVKRGLGTIRQDVNVSIGAGDRVEIKGVQDLRTMDTVVDFEVRRQQELVAVREELRNRNVKEPQCIIVDLTSDFTHTAGKVIRKALDAKGSVVAVRLPGWAGLLGHVVQPNRRVGSELSDHAKIHGGVGGLFHSDELPKYGITAEEVATVRERLSCSEQDAFILVAAPEENARRALHAAVARAVHMLIGVPREVRKARPDGTSSYMRPMPGAARMYPETDVKPIHVTQDMFDAITVPVLIEDKSAHFVQLGLGKDLADKIAKSPRCALFEKICSLHTGLKKAFVAETLVGAERYIKREFDIHVEHSDEEYLVLFGARAEGSISKDAIIDIIKNARVIDASSLEPYKMFSDAQVKTILSEIVAAADKKEFKAVIGVAMKQLRGKADGKKVSQMLRELLA